MSIILSIKIIRALFLTPVFTNRLESIFFENGKNNNISVVPGVWITISL